MAILFTMATDSQRKFGLDKNGNSNYGREVVNFFHKIIIIILIFDNILVVRLEGLFWAGNKVDRGWTIDMGLDFGLGLWRLHTMPGQRLQLLYFIGYFQPISLDSQQGLTIQAHGL
jgi:hypothetical protein